MGHTNRDEDLDQEKESHDPGQLLWLSLLFRVRFGSNGFSSHSSRLFSFLLAAFTRLQAMTGYRKWPSHHWTDESPWDPENTTGSHSPPNMQREPQSAQQAGWLQKGWATVGVCSVYNTLFGLILGKDLNKSHKEQRLAAAISYLPTEKRTSWILPLRLCVCPTSSISPAWELQVRSALHCVVRGARFWGRALPYSHTRPWAHHFCFCSSVCFVDLKKMGRETYSIIDYLLNDIKELFIMFCGTIMTLWKSSFRNLL